MYVDSIYVKHFQEVAQLISPMTTAPMSGCLSFYYQLQQRNDNIFSVYTRDAAGLYEEIWKAGDPGNAVWNLAEAEFSAPYPKEVGVPGVPWPGHSAEMPPRRGAGDTAGSYSFLLFLCVSVLISLFPSLAFSTFLPSSVFSLPSSSTTSFSRRVFLNKGKYRKASQPTRFLGHTLPLNLHCGGVSSDEISQTPSTWTSLSNFSSWQQLWRFPLPEGTLLLNLKKKWLFFSFLLYSINNVIKVRNKHDFGPNLKQALGPLNFLWFKTVHLHWVVNVQCRRIRKFREAKQTKMPYTSPAKKRTNILVFILEDLFVSTYSNTYLYTCSGLPRWHGGKDSACRCRRRKRLGFNPWSRKTPWRRKWQPTPVFLPGKSHGQRSLADYSPWGLKESNNWAHTCAHTHTHSYFSTDNNPTK